MIILGIDPGIAIVGYGVIEYTGNKFRVLDYNAVITPKEDPLALRLKAIYEQIGSVIDTYKPDYVSIEELFYNNNIISVEIVLILLNQLQIENWYLVISF